ncbi:MAG: 4-vinyl reductase [Oscillospiraceae bacterium]|nr:4-vinyl reductase [Oscillospiraceae bacterium]
MKNVFMENIMGNKKHNEFSWDTIGDIKKGRGDLGVNMPVLVYRLMQYTMLDVLSKVHGLEQANEYFRQAGFMAGSEFAKHVLDLTLDFNSFVSDFQTSLEKLKIGIMRMEAFDSETGNIMLTVGQDIDCSGLPITNENVCNYDEGFIAGILEAYTGKKYEVREVDCWANGDRVCRFSGKVTK